MYIIEKEEKLKCYEPRKKKPWENRKKLKKINLKKEKKGNNIGLKWINRQ